MYLGYNIYDRKQSGLRLFNKNRLIVEMEGNTWASWPLGVLACVDVPASLMQPSMSKQRFNDEREYKWVFSKIGCFFFKNFRGVGNFCFFPTPSNIFCINAHQGGSFFCIKYPPYQKCYFWSGGYFIQNWSPINGLGGGKFLRLKPPEGG